MSRRASTLLAIAALIAAALSITLAWHMALRLSALEDEVGQLQDKVAGLGADLDAANDSLDQAQTASERLRSAVDQLGLAVERGGRGNWRALGATIRDGLDEVEAAVEDLETALADDEQAPASPGPRAPIASGWHPAPGRPPGLAGGQRI